MVDRIIVIDNGQIVLDGPKAEVLAKLSGQTKSALKLKLYLLAGTPMSIWLKTIKLFCLIMMKISAVTMTKLTGGNY